MPRITKAAARSLRRHAGTNSAVEQKLRAVRDMTRYRVSGTINQTQFTAFRGNGTKRLGVFGYGGCDVWAVCSAGPRLQKLTGASGAVYARGRAGFTRSDLILQTWEGVDHDLVAEVVERLNLDDEIFQPTLFEPEFTLPKRERLGSYPKDIVVLTISTDLVRTLYRHREHGFLVDPGGFWLSANIDQALSGLNAVDWFRKQFEKVGRIDLESSMSNMKRIIELVRSEIGSEIVVFNALTVDPGRQVFDYKLSHSPHRTRRRKFGLALIELAREMDFSIVDVDRVIKGLGVSGLGDFVKFAPPHQRAIGNEFVRIIRDRELLPLQH